MKRIASIFLLLNKRINLSIPKKLISILLLGIPIPILSTHAQGEEIDILRQRVISDVLNEQGFVSRVSRYIVPDFSKAAAYLGEMETDGNWKSVDYQDTDNDWAPLQALNKILVMTHTYSHSGYELYKDRKLLKGIVTALNYWYQVNPNCVNWYKNDIAKQMYLGVIAVLLQDHIDDKLIQKMIEDQTSEPRMTGSNRTLLSISVFYRGILEKSPKRIASGVQGVMTQVGISENEGIQIDGSFHQHGAYLYNGNYGSNFLRETIWLAAMVEGSQFAFSKNAMTILRDYYFEGTRWMIRGNRVDYNVCGRHVGRPVIMNIEGDDVISQLHYFIKADPDYTEQYANSSTLIRQRKPQDLRGNKHYWRSDYTAHHRDSYFTSVHMCSERTVGVETHVNYENLLGRNIPYGLTYIYRKGNEYKDVFTAWDWAKLPGVTCSYEVPSEKGKYSQEVGFVGGVSDGKYGVSAMELNLRETKAKKAWFWFDKEWVALGVGIESTNENTILTGVNQSGLNGEVVVNGEKFRESKEPLSDLSWVWHDSIAYVFPKTSGDLYLEAKEKSGSMKRIYGLGSDSIRKKEIFSLWFDHGLQPQKAKYEYIIVPGVGPEEMDGYVKEMPIEVVSNTTQVQAVHHAGLGITGIVFHEAGGIQIGEKLSLKLNDAGLVLINHNSGQITISDPTAKLESLGLTVHSGENHKEELEIQLPQGQNTGKSIMIDKTFEF